MGFISILKIGNEQYRFATYNFSKVKSVVYKDDILSIKVKKGRYKLEVHAHVKEGRVLKAPKNGIMEDDIHETLQGITGIKLYKKDALIYSGKSHNAGIEVVDI